MVAGSTMLRAAVLATVGAVVTADEGGDMHCGLTVVGGGWGGAYFAYRMCIDTDTISCEEVCVFEANERFGGRAYSTAVNEEGVLDPLKVDVGPYRMRTSGAPTSTGAEEIIVGVTSSEEALGLPLVGYTNPEDSAFKVVDDGLGNNAGFNTPIYKMLEIIEEQGGRVFMGQRAEGVYRAAPGSNHPLIVRFATGDIGAVTADLAFLNTPWASVNQMDETSALFVDTNATARECVEMITSSSVSAKYYVQYDDAWWVTKLGLTEGTFSTQTEPRLAGRYHDGPLRCFEKGGDKKAPLNKRQVLDAVAKGEQEQLECSGLLLATYVFSNANYWLDFQANISDAKTTAAWAPPNAKRMADWRRRQLRGESGPRIGRRDPVELLQEYHETLLNFHATALEEAGYSPEDIDPPTWGYQGNWNSAGFLVRAHPRAFTLATGSSHDHAQQ